MRRYIPSAAIFLGFAFAASQPGPPPPKEMQPPPEQPIAFSHKAHVSLGVECKDCHSIPEPGFAAGFPQVVTCMACHSAIKTESPEVRKLAEFAGKNQSVPWVKVYAVPDYVYFSHYWHATEKQIECAVCHGPVGERDALAKEKETSMVACMSCHDQYKASNDCDLCHDPA